MKKIFTQKFVKYLIAGVSTVLLDFLSLIALKEVFFFSATLAIIINQLIIWLYNFNIHKYWTFSNQNLPYKQFLRYLVLALGNYLVSISAMYIFSDTLGFYYLGVRLVSIIALTLVNYIIYKIWVYA